jgi:hypothetical protein
LKAAGPRAESFTVRGFGEAAGLAGVAGFAEVTCFGDFSCFDEFLKTSENQPASLTSIGRSTNAAIAAMMVRRRGRTPKPDPAKFLPDDSNPYFPQECFCSRFMTAWRPKTPLTGIVNHALLARPAQDFKKATAKLQINLVLQCPWLATLRNAEGLGIYRVSRK